MIRGLFLDVFNQSIAGSYLIIAVMIARVLLKKAPKSIYCVLWLFVGLRLIMPFSFVSAFSLIPSGAEVRGNITQFMGNDSAKAGHHTAFDTTSPDNAEYINEEMIRAIGNNNDSAESVNRPFVYFTIASVIWLVGIGVMLLYLMISWFRIARSVRLAIPDEWEGIKYYRCENITSPFLFGFLKPRIYVPFGLSAEDLGYVLKHETVHIQRKDYLIKPIGYALLTVYWFNPFVWAAYILLCRDIEFACDERVIKELGGEHKKEYALALLSCSVNHRTIAACPVAFGETGVKGRIKNVLSYKKPTFWVIIAAVAACAVIAVCFMTEKAEADIAENNSGSQFIIVNPANDQGTENSSIDYYAYVQQWAEAFCGRDGKTIVEMLDENAENNMSDRLNLSKGINDNNEPYVAFGWSSPWPWGGEEEAKNYRIVSISDGGAVILYYAWVSDPHVTVWREQITYKVTNGDFKVIFQHIDYLEGICVAEEFYNAYPDGEIDGTMMDYYAYNQVGEALNDNSKNPNMASSAYTGLREPDTAAIRLLNILNNKNKVNTSVEYLNEEKTEAVVTFTFMENASTAKVKMIKPYGDDSIWLPQTY